MQADEPGRDEAADARDGEATARPSPSSLAGRRRRRLITLGLLRAGASSALLVVLYYVLPLDRSSPSSLAIGLAVGLVAFVVTTSWQVRAIVRSTYPGIRATEALATAVPFFLLVFASTYFMLGFQYPETFSEPLSRSDALYFTITTFATVGFGDIVPRSEAVRLLVAVQMLLDLVILGLGVQVILGAVKKGRAV